MMVSHFTIWILVMAPLVFASQNVQYLSMHNGGSVDLICDSEDKSQPVIGLYLKRKCPPETEVLFILHGAEPQVLDPFKGRTDIHGDMSTHQINVTISSLSHNDSGLYACEFILGDHLNHVMGRTKYLLFVEKAESHCSCAGYSFLLYIISGATALFLLFSFGLGVALCSRACHPSKPPKPLPIYEDMTAIRPKDRTLHHHLDSLHLEEVDTMTYDKPHVKLSQENHYVAPRRGSRVPGDSETQALNG